MGHAENHGSGSAVLITKQCHWSSKDSRDADDPLAITENENCGESEAQYVARPPLMSKTAPVVNEFSAETSHATMEAISPTSTNLSRGIFDSM